MVPLILLSDNLLAFSVLAYIWNEFFFKEKKLNSLPAKGLFNSILTAYKSRHWAIHNITKVVLSKTPTQVYDTWFQILQTLIYRIDYIILLIKVIKPHDTVWYPENNVENQKALPD